MQIPRVYFDSEWPPAEDFHPISCRLSTDRIELGLMGLFVGLEWPHDGPKRIEEILDDMGVDIFLNKEQEQRLREKLNSMRTQK